MGSLISERTAAIRVLFPALIADDCVIVLDDRQLDALISALREIEALGDIDFVLERCQDLDPGYALDWDNGGTSDQDAVVDDVMDRLARELFFREEVAVIIPADYEGLATLCWNRDPLRPIEREEAWALYRRNWRLVWQDTLDDAEIALIRGLQAEFGEVLLGTTGPTPPWAQSNTPTDEK